MSFLIHESVCYKCRSLLLLLYLIISLDSGTHSFKKIIKICVRYFLYVRQSPFISLGRQFRKTTRFMNAPKFEENRTHCAFAIYRDNFQNGDTQYKATFYRQLIKSWQTFCHRHIKKQV